MNMLTRIISKKRLVLLYVFCSLAMADLAAQKVNGVVDFDFYFDNREFFTSYAPHYTVFGTRVAPGVHLTGKENHELRLGLWYQKKFGDLTNDEIPAFFGSYLFHNQNFDMELGFIPRKKINMHRFLLNDTLYYIRPYLQGMSFFINQKHLSQELWLDWISAQTDTIRESFMIGNTGDWYANSFFVHHEFLMIHHALPANPAHDDHIRDNFGGMITLGYQINKSTMWDSLSIETGGMFSIDRLRSVYDWQTPGGLYMAASYRKAGIGIDLSHYQGSKHQLLYGDRFYTANRYTRGDISYHLFRKANLHGEIKLSFHLLPEGLDFAQSFRLFYAFKK
ncbi:MAG: hypothetical protein ACOC0C_04720 [Bacteroidota bacterium]